MLEKEQSLLTRTSLGSTTLARAVGAGCPGSLVYPATNPVATNRYPGFGNQIWNGARLLDMYGEASKGSGIPPFTAGMSYPVYTGKVYPANWATYKLYIYNPSIDGNTNFWNIYLKHFGNPAGNPINGPAGAVFRFYNVKNGTHFYSASLDESNRVAALMYSRYRYEGVGYVADPGRQRNAPLPVLQQEEGQPLLHGIGCRAGQRAREVLEDVHVRGRRLQRRIRARSGSRDDLPLLQQEDRDALLHRLPMPSATT